VLYAGRVSDGLTDTDRRAGADWPTGIDRRWVISGLAAAVVALAAFAGPWGANMIDLKVYRVGADAVLHGHDLYAAVEPSTGLLFTYPVFAAVMFVPFGLLPEMLARLLVTSLSIAALVVIVHLTVRRVLAAGSAGRTVGTAAAWTAGLSVLAVGVHPVWDTFTFGQVNLILTAMVLIDVLSPDRGRWRGVLVGLAAGIKLVPGLFIVYFLVTGQRRAALTSALTTAGTMLVGFAAQPGPAWDFWTVHALNPERTGGVAYVTNQSFLGVTARLMRDPHPPRALTIALSALAVIVALVIARQLHRRGDVFTSVGVIGVASLLASPISWSHHWVWAIPCLGAVAIWARQAVPGAGVPGRWRWVIFGVCTVTIVGAPMQFTPKEDLRELDHTLVQQVLASSYTLLALAFLAWAAVRAFRTPARTRDALTGSRA
jgi:alpha-1,2-mannosyltransferase